MATTKQSPSNKTQATHHFAHRIISSGSLLGLLMFSPLSHAEDWLTFPITSKHFEDRKNPRGWNEFNPGIGYEYTCSNSLLLTGLVYKNSYAKPTFGAGIIWHPLEYSIFKLGLATMVATGYAPPFMVAPILSIEYKGFGADIVVAPSLGKDTAGFVGLMLKFQI